MRPVHTGSRSSRKRMKILFCQTSPYIPEERGGALANTHELCLELLLRGTEPAVLAGSRDGWTRLRGWADRISPDRGLPYPVFREPEPVRVLDTILARFRPDVAVVQLGAVGDAARALVERGVPTIVFLHDPFTAPPGSLGPHPALRFAASSRALANTLQDSIGAEFAVIPVLVNPEHYKLDGVRTNAVLVNPIPRKGLEIALALAARRPDIPFEFLESWKLSNRVFTHLRARCSLHGNIRLTPAMENPRPVYSRCRLLLVPSLWFEAWGRVVSEAQVNGIPALASDSGGLPEAVGPGGIIVSRDAPIGEWAAALSRIWDDHTAFASYSKAALAHATRPEIEKGYVVAKFLDLVGQSLASARS
jgi:glycosyltransferase involved in cell wall biosynthesis